MKTGGDDVNRAGEDMSRAGADMSDQRSIDELAAAYALDALDPAERALFEAGASPEARAEAEAMAGTASLLSGDEVAPPPSLRANLLDAISAEPQLPAVAAPIALPVRGERAPERSDASATTEPPRRVGPAERRARARWRPLRMAGAVAAGAALLAGGVAIGTQLGGPSQQEALGAVVSAADARSSEVELEGGATATLVWSGERGQSVILFDGLEAAPQGQTYQAWYIDASGPTSAGIFQAAAGSTAVLLEGQLDAGVVVGVTVEPEGGSDAPTTEPFLVVET